MKSTILFLLGAVNAIIGLGLGFCIAAEIGIQISDDYELLFCRMRWASDGFLFRVAEFSWARCHASFIH